MKNINSHIQLPNGILKYFRDECDPEKKVWYLDISTGNIMRKPAGKLGTSKGYFSEAGESFWNEEIETPLTRLNNEIRLFNDLKIESVQFSAEDIATFKRYIKAAAIRSNLACRTMMNKSVTAALFTDQENHDALSYFGMSINGEFDQLLMKMNVSILLNRTPRFWVVPRNCYYSISSSGKETLVAPISPTCALLYLTENIQGYYAEVTNSVDIEIMNVAALKYEYMFNGAFVASNSQFELKALQCFRQKHLPELERLPHLLEN
ncbi:MAG: hypothetical protein GXW99_08100 [Clostridiales bacterium]|nr:hypothetical protein [Clostridiales bacterium]